MAKIKVKHKVSRWNAPPKNDVRLLGMPNIPDALQGPGCQPRTIVGNKGWDIMRKKCYADAGYKCEICGYEHQFPADLHAHEVYDIDYTTGVERFVRLACLCRRCHIYWIHSGRALTMYKHGDPLYSKEKLLEGAEHGFKLISEYNKTHKKPIYAFMSIAQYSWQEELSEPMRELVEKYNIEFYCPVAGKKQANWEDWKLIWNGKEYPTPYKNHEEYVAKMRELNKKNATHTERKSAIDNEVVKALQKELNNF